MNDEDQAINEWEESFDVNTDESEEVDTSEDSNAESDEGEVQDTAEDTSDDTKDEPKEEEQPEPKEENDTKEEEQEEEETPPEEPQPLTRDDIKDALRELETEKISHVSEIDATAKEVLDSFYPQGVSRELRDKDGDPIRTIEDVMDRVNPTTGENFTQEEAGQWLLTEQQKLNQQVDELDRSAQRVAEVNVDIRQNVSRVIDKYKSVLEQYPDVANQAKQLYEKTLRKDGRTGIIVEAPVDMVEFYDTFLQPYVAGLPQQQPPAPTPKAKASPDERGDLPPTKGDDNMSKEEREWAEIAKEYHEL